MCIEVLKICEHFLAASQLECCSNQLCLHKTCFVVFKSRFYSCNKFERFYQLGLTLEMAVIYPTVADFFTVLLRVKIIVVPVIRMLYILTLCGRH